MSFLALFIASFIALVGAIAAMAVGVLFGRRAISGSCGGIAGRCAGCGGSGECPRRRTHGA